MDLCQSVHVNGLVGLAQVAVDLAHSFPNDALYLKSGDFEVSGSSKHKNLKAHLEFNCEGGSSSIRAVLHHLTVSAISTNAISDRTAYTTNCTVSFYWEYNADTTASIGLETLPHITTDESLQILRQMTDTIINGICEEVIFDSLEDVPPLLADGILRSLQYPDPRLYLCQVKVKVSFNGDSPLGFCKLSATKNREDGSLPVTEHTIMQMDKFNSLSHTKDIDAGTFSPGAQAKVSCLPRRKDTLREQPDASTSQRRGYQQIGDPALPGFTKGISLLHSTITDARSGAHGIIMDVKL